MNRCRERMLRSQPVIDSQHLHAGVMAQAAANVIVRVQIAEHETAAMEVEDKAVRSTVSWLVKAHRDSSVPARYQQVPRSEEHTSELQSRGHLVCRLLLEKK